MRADVVCHAGRRVGAAPRRRRAPPRRRRPAAGGALRSTGLAVHGQLRDDHAVGVLGRHRRRRAARRRGRCSGRAACWIAVSAGAVVVQDDRLAAGERRRRRVEPRVDRVVGPQLPAVPAGAAGRVARAGGEGAADPLVSGMSRRIARSGARGVLCARSENVGLQTAKAANAANARRIIAAPVEVETRGQPSGLWGVGRHAGDFRPASGRARTPSAARRRAGS